MHDPPRIRHQHHVPCLGPLFLAVRHVEKAKDLLEHQLGGIELGMKSSACSLVRAERNRTGSISWAARTMEDAVGKGVSGGAHAASNAYDDAGGVDICVKLAVDRLFRSMEGKAWCP